MLHLAHPKDVITVQVLTFCQVLLYFGYEVPQNDISKYSYRNYFHEFCHRQLKKHHNTKFFRRTNKLLESVISSIG